MAEQSASPTFDFDLGDGGTVRISTAEELRAWARKEFEAWQWLSGNSRDNVSRALFGRHQNFINSVSELAVNWLNATSVNAEQCQKQARDLFKNYYGDRRILSSSSVDGAFVFDLKKNSGETIAAAACAALVGQGIPGQVEPGHVEGMFRAFVYKRGIDLTGNAHAEVLTRLKSQYEANIGEQRTAFKEIEDRSNGLVHSLGEVLKERSSALQKLESDHVASFGGLRAEQEAAFKALITKHEENLKAIEQTYDQKLALQKPVDYWESEEKFHSKRARWFGFAGVVVLVALAAGLGVVIREILAGLGPNDNPAHWQIGLILITLFFSIWVIRVIVRIFLSHLHLARDAGERRVMILTYLSMAREGAPFAPEDKTLVLNHLFRSAADGLVKDDATPATSLELLSRRP